MLKISNRKRDQFNSPVVGMNMNPIASTCLASEATKYEYQTELKGSFLGWLHPKTLGHFIERSIYTLFVSRNHLLIFERQ